jgi:hypothetical protein
VAAPGSRASCASFCLTASCLQMMILTNCGPPRVRIRRITLWLSLFRGLAGDRAWDPEGLSGELANGDDRQRVAPSRTRVVDRDGDVLLDREGAPATTKQSRGKIHWAVQRSLAALDLRMRLLRLTPLGRYRRKSASGTTYATPSRTRPIGPHPHCRREARGDATRLLERSPSQHVATVLTADGSGTRRGAAPRLRSC